MQRFNINNNNNKNIQIYFSHEIWEKNTYSRKKNKNKNHVLKIEVNKSMINYMYSELHSRVGCTCFF